MVEVLMESWLIAITLALMFCITVGLGHAVWLMVRELREALRKAWR